MAEITIRISDKALKVAGILVGGICLAWTVFYLWSTGFFLSKYRLRMYASEAAGLVVGAPVRLDGIDIGAVDAINLAGNSATAERRIELVLRIERRHQGKILSGSTATLTTEGLLGSRYEHPSRIQRQSHSARRRDCCRANARDNPKGFHRCLREEGGAFGGGKARSKSQDLKPLRKVVVPSPLE